MLALHMGKAVLSCQVEDRPTRVAIDGIRHFAWRVHDPPKVARARKQHQQQTKHGVPSADRGSWSKPHPGAFFTSLSKLPHGEVLFSAIAGSTSSCPIYSPTDHCAWGFVSLKPQWHIDCYFAACTRCADSRYGDGEKSSGCFFCLQAPDGSLVFAPALGEEIDEKN